MKPGRQPPSHALTSRSEPRQNTSCSDHGFVACENFKKMSIDDSHEWNIANEHTCKPCFRCLSDGHCGEACFRSRVDSVD